MVKLQFHKVEDWPKLAWVAQGQYHCQNLVVFHGRCVELSDQWCAEAVWAGEFSDGDFDKTEIVFGTGIRCREQQVVFVSSGTMMDRLWMWESSGRFYLSNSLPALLACTGQSLSEAYLDYPRDIHTMTQGLHQYCDSIPAEGGGLGLAYYHNVVYDSCCLRKTDKVNTVPEFTCYTAYLEYLKTIARQLRINYQSPARKFIVSPLATVSAGYDSCAAAKLARDAGCRETVTIVNASSFLPRKDSGREAARYLDLSCREYHHRQRNYRYEVSVWSAAGEPAGLNLTIFDYPEPLCLFFTGYRGDSLWRREKLDRSEPFAVNTIEGLGMCEYRLIQGIFHCPVPFWGSRRAEQIQAITFSPEMEPWTLHTHYDRPIPRRILEEAGVPRNCFGIRKEATIVDRSFLWPFLPESRACFAAYLQERNLYSPSASALWLLRKLAHLDQLVTVNLNHILKKRRKGFRHLFQIQGQTYLFHWANTELKKRYQKAFHKTLSSLPQEKHDD